MSEGRAKILVVDDTPRNVKLLRDILIGAGHLVSTASSGPEALEVLAKGGIDLVLLDVVMPGMTGYEVCREIRSRPETELLPVVLVTALDADEERLKGTQAGADDFLAKPINQAELHARLKSLLRIRTLHERVGKQATELAAWNEQLERRVADQMSELERHSQLVRFVSPQLAELIVSGSNDHLLESHRREITVVVIDLRGFARFSETAEPEQLMGLLGQYHEAMGDLIGEHEGTVGRFAEGNIMVFFNDPIEVADPERRAVRMAIALRHRVEALGHDWKRSGSDLEFVCGIDLGYATLGLTGFEGRRDYAAVGPVTQIAAALCDRASGGQIVLSKRVLARVEDLVSAEPLGKLDLRGFSRPVTAYNAKRDDSASAAGRGLSSLEDVGEAIGHYKIVRLLGQGGMGAVYLAEDDRLGRSVALKVLPFSGQAEDGTETVSADKLARFEREARAVAALNHPNIVTIYSVEKFGNLHFLTMEMVEGKTLSSLIPSGGLSREEFRRLSIQLAEAVGAAHQQGIIHRDLKPDNVMVNEKGWVKVLDFGLAKLKEGSSAHENTQTLTEEGSVMGTFRYMSPEQVRGRELDSSSDIFSIGLILHEMATGQLPFQGKSDPEIVAALLKEKPVLDESLPADLGALIGRCLRKRASKRFRDASELCTAMKASI